MLLFLSSPKFLLNTLFSDTFIPRSSLCVRDHASHAYELTCKIII